MEEREIQVLINRDKIRKNRKGYILLSRKGHLMIIKFFQDSTNRQLKNRKKVNQISMKE